MLCSGLSPVAFGWESVANAAQLHAMSAVVAEWCSNYRARCDASTDYWYGSLNTSLNLAIEHKSKHSHRVSVSLLPLHHAGPSPHMVLLAGYAPICIGCGRWSGDLYGAIRSGPGLGTYVQWVQKSESLTYFAVALQNLWKLLEKKRICMAVPISPPQIGCWETSLWWDRRLAPWRQLCRRELKCYPSEKKKGRMAAHPCNAISTLFMSKIE